MCGGISSAFHMQASGSGPRCYITPLFHVGRLGSYAIIGFLFGFLIDAGDNILFLGSWLRILAGLMLIAMGLYLSGIWRGLSIIESAMAPIWAPIGRRMKRILPIRKPQHALIAGLFWGWLPCGLVYSTLIWASTTGVPAESALLMFAMGIGTLPAMLGIGWITRWLQHNWLRTTGAFALCVFGLWTLATPTASLIPTDHTGHANSHSHGPKAD